MCNDEAERYYGYGAELESFLPVAAECDEQGTVIIEMPRGWASLDDGAEVLPLAEPILAVVDVDDIDTDLLYARKQLQGVAGCHSLTAIMDRVQRALDALDRLDDTCQKAAEDAAGF